MIPVLSQRIFLCTAQEVPKITPFTPIHPLDSLALILELNNIPKRYKVCSFLTFKIQFHALYLGIRDALLRKVRKHRLFQNASKQRMFRKKRMLQTYQTATTSKRNTEIPNPQTIPSGPWSATQPLEGLSFRRAFGLQRRRVGESHRFVRSVDDVWGGYVEAGTNIKQEIQIRGK
jgi:hypothetical protein